MLNIHFYVLFDCTRANHIWHENKQLFPPGEGYAQVSWRQFRCGGAGKLIFPKIIWIQQILAAFLSRLCLPASEQQAAHLGIFFFSGEYIMEHRSALQNAVHSVCPTAKCFKYFQTKAKYLSQLLKSSFFNHGSVSSITPT